MKKPEIFKSTAIIIHLLAWVVAATGMLLASIFGTMTGFMWVIMPSGLLAFLSGFVALPTAIIGAYRSARERQFGVCIQYGAICMLSGGIVLTGVAMKLIAPGRH